MAQVIALGRLSPITWPEVEGFARALAEFCKVHVTPDQVVTTRFDHGEIELRWAGGAAGLRLIAQGEAALQNLRDTLAHMLDHARAGLSQGLHWQDDSPLAGRLPPNFRQGRIARTDRIGPRFMRLRIEAPDLAYLNQTGLHLRLLQPRDRAAPRWPRLAANGRTEWPGAEHLHMPVYTIRAIDPVQGWLDVDVFLHGNGPTCAWAQGARVGDAVGLTGPGGGWLPDQRHLVLGGDETALPVIARILEQAPAETTGHAIIAVADLADAQPIAAPAGVRIDWLTPRDGPLGPTFAKAARGARASEPGACVLFAAEKLQAQMVRAALSDASGKPPAGVTSAAYWTRAAG